MSQLSRLLFDSAANKWYLALIFEVATGVFAAALIAVEPDGDWALAGAMAGVFMIGIAYLLRLWFDAQYDAAETMRRQAVLTEGLGWEISGLQSSEWLQKAGRRVRKRLKVKPRDPDYYTTKVPPGATRLAQMTTESAFYTRILYEKLRDWLWGLVAVTVILFIFSLSVALSQAVPERVDALVARVIFAIIPLVLSVNFIGWAFKLGRSIAAIREVEADLDRLQQSGSIDEPQVMRLLTEYNCQVVGGFPIHTFLFNRWHPEARELWERRRS